MATHDVGPDRLRATPTFATVSDDVAQRFLGTAREQHYQAGQHVADRWAYQRTFYLVVAGRLSVRVGEREVNILGPSDHFGEIAAIDWGRDFSYGRTATVVAQEPSRLLAFPASAVRELMADDPDVDRELRRIAHDRLRDR
jgi:CRP-like cAMP-binding protein